MVSKPDYFSPDSYFLSFDLGLASALLTLGYKLADIDKSNRSKAQFVFRRRTGIDRDIEKYWGGRLNLDAKAFFDSMRCIKNQLYSD